SSHLIGVCPSSISSLSLHDALPISGCNLHGHHLVAAAVEQFAAVRVPSWLRTTFRRDLPLAAGPRIRLHVDFIASGLIRDIDQPAAIWGKPRHAFIERRSEEWLRLVVA